MYQNEQIKVQSELDLVYNFCLGAVVILVFQFFLYYLPSYCCLLLHYVSFLVSIRWRKRVGTCVIIKEKHLVRFYYMYVCESCSLDTIGWRQGKTNRLSMPAQCPLFTEENDVINLAVTTLVLYLLTRTGFQNENPGYKFGKCWASGGQHNLSSQ